MSCYHPAVSHCTVDKATGEVTTKYLGSIEKFKQFELFDLLKDNRNGNKQLVGKVFESAWTIERFVEIPCGKCIGCRMDYSRSWADRMTYHSFGKEDCSYFVTLTYDDEHQNELPHSDNYDLYGLDFSHSDDFIKKLRNKYRDAQIDMYYSGEYGDASLRPHFHMILYNLFIDDLVFDKLNDNGDPLYTSSKINSLWGRGFAVIGKFSWRNAAYTARYVEKKRDGRKLCEYEAVGLTPERCRSSRRPGIAFDYYNDHFEEIWQNNGLNVDRSCNSQGHLGIPRYFRKLAEDKGIGFDYFKDWQKRSLDRQNILNPLKFSNSSFDENSVLQMLAFEEREVLLQKKNRYL